MRSQVQILVRVPEFKPSRKWEKALDLWKEENNRMKESKYNWGLLIIYNWKNKPKNNLYQDRKPKEYKTKKDLVEIRCVAENVIFNIFGGQASKGVWWMPWH